jgi:integrase
MAINKTVAGSFSVDYRDQFKKRHLKTFKRKAAAVAFEKQVLHEVATREYVQPSSETVKDIAAKWLERKHEAGTYKRGSLESWRNHVQRFINVELGHLKVRDVDIEAIEKAAAAWAERTSPGTANKIMTTLVAVLDLAKRYRLVKENPAHSAERLKLATADEDQGEVTADQVYDKAELGRLIAATEPGSRDRVFVMVLALTGLRIGEALALTWPAIDLKGGRLQVLFNLADSAKGEEPTLETPKTASSRRTLALPPELLTELRVWKLKCPKSERELVFATEEGKPYHRKSAGKMLDRAIKKAQLEKRLTPHGLRHTFASLLLADGIPAPEVGSYLGHRDCGVTLKVYAHFVRRETGALRNLASSILAEGQR